MRITSIVLTPDGSADTCTLSFRDPTRQNSYNVQSISGLDASDGIIPKFYGNAGNSAARFYNLFMQKRDVVFSIQLNPQFSLGKSYSDLRDDLYKMIASSRTGLITISFSDENGVIANLVGFTSKFENDHFQKDPVVILTISAVNPLLISPNLIEVSLVDLDPTNFVITDSQSTSPHGLNFTADVIGAPASLTVVDPTDDSWSFAITPAGGFLAGDELHFSSDPLNKVLYVVRAGAVVYLGDAITPGSIWPVIFPGDNHLSFGIPASIVFTDISYYPTYWGV